MAKKKTTLAKSQTKKKAIVPNANYAENEPVIVPTDEMTDTALPTDTYDDGVKDLTSNAPNEVGNEETEVAPTHPITPDEPKVERPKKTRTKLGDATSIIAGCSYHFFRKYFKKAYAAESIKVRFVKEEKGYNGHIEVAETDREKAIQILLIVKKDNVEVKKLFWFK